MATDSVFSDTQKITLTVPKVLLARLDELVPPRRRSHFIVEAIEERLTMAEQIAAIEEGAGIWSDEDHPDMMTGEDIDNWLENLRRSWTRPESLENDQILA